MARQTENWGKIVTFSHDYFMIESDGAIYDTSVFKKANEKYGGRVKFKISLPIQRKTEKQNNEFWRVCGLIAKYEEVSKEIVAYEEVLPEAAYRDMYPYVLNPDGSPKYVKRFNKMTHTVDTFLEVMRVSDASKEDMMGAVQVARDIAILMEINPDA